MSLPLLALPVRGDEGEASSSAGAEPSSGGGSRRKRPFEKGASEEGPADWRFFAMPWGPSAGGVLLKQEGIVDDNDERLVLKWVEKFADSQYFGCGDGAIASFLREDLGGTGTTMLVVGLHSPLRRRVVALATLTIGGVDDNFSRFVTGYQHRYISNDWFDADGAPLPLVDDTKRLLGGERALVERLTFHFGTVCSASSASVEDARPNGAGAELLRATREYLCEEAAPHLRRALQRASNRKDQEKRIASDAWLDAMIKRDLWMDLQSVDNAIGFYSKCGFETVPYDIQTRQNINYEPAEGWMWRQVFA